MRLPKDRNDRVMLGAGSVLAASLALIIGSAAFDQFQSLNSRLLDSTAKLLSPLM